MDVPKLTLAQLQGLIDDREEVGKGALLFDKKALSQLARYQNKLFCEAAEKEAATVELARRVVEFLYRAQHQPEDTV